MGATYTRQSSYTDGDTITAAHTNDEFNQLLAAFASSTGHTHDGTSAEGGPITKLLGNTLTFGAGTAGTDITITFDGETSDGVLKWMEDEDYFEFSDDILVASTEKLQFRDTAIYINSSADGQLDLVADTEIQIAATTIDMNGNVDISGTLTIGGADISETELEILDGATVTTTEINVLDGDTSATSTTVADADRVVFNDAGTMKQVAVTDLAAYFDDEITAMPNLVTTGALNSGSITSGFGTIDTGSSTITTTGLITGGSLDIDDVVINGSTIGHTDDTDLITVANGIATVAGEISVTTLDIGGTNVTSTAAELNYSDTGAAVGTVVASKVVTVDSNKDVASFRNITLTGELDAGSLDVSGDADIDGTLEADAITVNGTALNTVIAGVTVTDATNSAHVLVTDNESTNEENLITFVEDATSSTGNVGLEMDGNLTYNPSTGTITATIFKGNIDAVDGDFDGTLEADAMTLNGTAITATATLDTGISNNNVPKFTSGVADNDFLRVDGTAIEGRSASEVLSDIGAAPAAGDSNIVTTGALNSGSITSGFGAIDNGSSNITTTGVITGGTLEATADTSAGDNAAIGFTSAEGLILTGQGSTSDITFKNDADTTVFSIPTGTDDISFPDNAAILMGAGNDLKIFHNGSNSQINDLSTGNLQLLSNGAGVDVLKTDGEVMAKFITDGAVELYHDNSKKLETASTGVDVTGNVTATGTVEPAGDTAAGDNAAIGYTAAEGLILTGQGSTSDVTIKNDADATVAFVPTGADDLRFPDNAELQFGDSADLKIYHNGSTSFIEDVGTGNFLITTNGNNIQLMKQQSEQMLVAKPDDAVELYYDNVKKLETSSTGAFVAGKLDVGSVGASGGTAGEIAFGGVGGSIDGFRIHNTDGNYLEFRPSSTDAPMVLNNVGNVGIGIDSPTLDSSLAGVSVSGSSTVLHIHDGDGAVLKLTDPSSGANRGGQIALLNTHMLVNNCESDAISFGTGNAEKMRLDNNGQLGIGTSSPAAGLDLRTGLNGNSQFLVDDSTTGGSGAGGAFLKFMGSNATAEQIAGIDGSMTNGSDGSESGILAFFTMNSGTSSEKFRIASNGDLTATDTSIASNSDQRIKDNISDFAYDLDKFKEFKTRTFDWKQPTLHGEKSGVRGFVAQELEAIDSYWVSEIEVASNSDDYQYLPDTTVTDDSNNQRVARFAKTSKLGQKDAMYVSVIQQLIAKIEILETKVAALEE